MLLLGYNTNGFAHHLLEDAIVLLADMGYQSIALTLDYHALDPFSSNFSAQSERVRNLLERYRLRCVIETGARFLLDIHRKHQPTLLDPDPELRLERIDFLRQAVELASFLHADAVSFWSGSAPSSSSSALETEECLMARLVDGCLSLCDFAQKQGVRLAFEPEPGMFIDTMTKFGDLFSRVNHPHFGLTLDVGHLYCLGEVPGSPHLAAWQKVLWNIHIEDMRRASTII
jgi:sugar phosphate isomerase/epimerase